MRWSRHCILGWVVVAVLTSTCGTVATPQVDEGMYNKDFITPKAELHLHLHMLQIHQPQRARGYWI
jgi:hypothetical protein